MYKLEREGLDSNIIMEILSSYSKGEPSPASGRMFTHSYETGDLILRSLARNVFDLFMDKTMLDFTIYPSILLLEREVVGIVASLMGGDENTTGSFTYGGTESIILAVKAARDKFRSSNPGVIPEIIIPYTGHPAFIKASRYLGLKPVLAKVNFDTMKVDIDNVSELITKNTAIIVGSAPNYPYGSIDDIKGLSELALDYNIWLHVDACLGGFTLPFLRDLGEEIPEFTFKLEGVSSISVDLHKYGYAPKGSSIILYRDRSLRRYQIFTYAGWPGYPLVNTTILSTRSAGPLAASWAILKYLGYNGYMNMTRKILKAKRDIIRGLNNLGLKIIGKPEASIVAFTAEDTNISVVSLELKKRGWSVQLQPGSKHLGFPPSIHLTISPVHEGLTTEFLEGLRDSIEASKQYRVRSDIEIIAKQIESRELSIYDILNIIGAEAVITLSDELLLLINELIRIIPPDIVDEIISDAVNILV
ncbi:MAG: aspartate aminotransferase family protein [Acidilobaceae archaeon]